MWRSASPSRSAPTIGYPYHPHVTVAHDLPVESLRKAYDALATFRADFRVWGFSLFEQGPDLVWRPQRDVTFGGGGLPGPPEAPMTSREAGW